MMLQEPFMSPPLRGHLEFDADMARHVSWRAGGRAACFYTPADLDDLVAFLRSRPAAEPLCFVGLGSNLLVRDGGYPGCVVHLHAALNGLRLDADDRIYAEAGVASPKLARFAARHGRVGAEFLAGIPGTVGGALAMNAGCYGRETWMAVERVLTIDRHGTLRQRTPDEYAVGYRQVALQKPGAEEWFVAAWFRFAAGDGELAGSEIKALLARRVASQPLDLPNAGSVFRNPPGDHAARLIEACSLKGLRRGGAQVSEKHANFIVNLGGATAADIEGLIEAVQAGVAAQTGVQLHREVRIIGER